MALSSEEARRRGRMGGRTTAAKGRKHMSEIGKRGGRTTATKGHEYMSEIGKRGYETMVQRYFDGDEEAQKRWFIETGLWASDPAPWNGAFRWPGEFPRWRHWETFWKDDPPAAPPSSALPALLPPICDCPTAAPDPCPDRCAVCGGWVVPF